MLRLPDLFRSLAAIFHTRRTLIVGGLALLVAFMIGLIGWLHGVYVEREHRHRHQAERELQSINQLQLRAVLSWRERSLRDARMLTEDELLAGAVGRWLSRGDVAAREQVRDRLRALKELGRYSEVLLLGPEGETLLMPQEGPGAYGSQTLPPREQGAMARALASADAVMGEPALTAGFAFPVAGVFAPLFDGDETLGAVWLVQDLRTGLLPAIEPWPTPSRTARSNIVWREADHVRYLNAPRDAASGMLQYRHAMEQSSLAAIQALSGVRGVFYGIDEQARPVMATASPVAETGWLLVSVVEVAEVFADVRRRELLALALPVSVALLAVGLPFVIALRRGWRRERALKLDLQSNLLWLESAQQAAGIGHFAIDPVIGTVHMSSLCQDIFGVRDDEITMAQWLSLIDAEDRGELKTVLARVRSGEDATRVQCRILPVDDRTALRWVEIWCRAFDQERPGDPRVIGIAQDITDRKAVEAELAGYRRRLEAQVRLDALTGLSNRRALDEAAAFQLAQAVRGGTPLALMMIDVDFFKNYNDLYGHLVGDKCLRSVASALAAHVGRAGEMVARYGGEEFAVLLPLQGDIEALALAERMCRAVRDLKIEHGASEVAPVVTVSVGVACLRTVQINVDRAREHGDADDASDWPLMHQLFVEADTALYQAKRLGRNRVVLHGYPTTRRYG